MILSLGETVQYAGKHKAETMQPGLGMPSPTGHGKEEAQVARQSAEIHIRHGLGRKTGMHIKRNVQRVHRLEDRRKARIVEKNSIQGTHRNQPFELELIYAAFQLHSRLFRRLKSQRRECGKAIRMGRDSGGQRIVRIMRERVRCGCIQLVETRA